MGAMNPSQGPGMSRKGSVQFQGLISGPVLTDQTNSQVQVDILKTELYNLRFSQTYKPIFGLSLTPVTLRCGDGRNQCVTQHAWCLASTQWAVLDWCVRLHRKWVLEAHFGPGLLFKPVCLCHWFSTLAVSQNDPRNCKTKQNHANRRQKKQRAHPTKFKLKAGVYLEFLLCRSQHRYGKEQ